MNREAIPKISKRRTTIKKNSKNGNNGGIRKKPSSIKTPMPVRPGGTTMSEPENMQTASEDIQMQEPQTGNKRGRMQEVDVSLSSPLQQQQKVEDSSNMSLSPSVDEAQVPGALSPVQEMQDSANAPLSTSGEELALGAVTPPPLKEMQDSAANAPLSPLGEEPVQNSEDVSPIPPSLEEVQDLTNISLSPSSVESGAGAVEAQVPGAGAPLPLKEVENVSLSQSADDAQSKLGAPPPPPLAPEMSGQEQVMQESIDVKPVVAEKQKEEDPIRDALVKQLDEIKQQTKVIEDALTNSAAGGGIKKRKKTYYKKYKSKKSMKRRNKTSRNK